MIKKQHIQTFITTIILTSSIAHADIKIKLSRNLPSNQETLLLRDFDVLEKIKFKKRAENETLKVMGLRNLNKYSFTKWLEDRIGYIIEDMDEKEMNSKILVFNKPYIYENPDEFPTFDMPDAEVEVNPNVMTVMSNLGSSLYEVGKDMKRLLGMEFKESFWSSEIIKFSSPRTGLIMVGEGLFHKRFLIDKNDHKATSNSLSRLATLYHEARHSDGAGVNLGFGHAICPKGHDYYNFYACEKNTNGPYSVGAVVMKEMIKNCNDCSTADKEKFKVKILDSKSRIIKEYDKEVNIASNEIIALELRLKLLKVSSGLDISVILKDQDNREIKELEEKIAILTEANTIVVHKVSKHIDPTPEGRRLK